MNSLVKIDGKPVDVAEFIRTLKLSGKFEGLIDQLVRDRLTVQAAKKAGIRVTEQDIQERADQFRRARGLHRATDTNKYLDALHISLDEFEAFISDSLYQERMLEQVCSEQAVQSYFKLNSPKFDSVEVSHMVLDSEGKAKEMVSVLADDPDSFTEMAREHSIAPTREAGGRIGKVLRGALRTDIEAKVFNAAVGEVLGPFASADRSTFELFRVDTRHAAKLDDATRTEVQRVLREGWLHARAQEHLIEAC
ncbi:MAG: peptidylprolyl isomerase [Burkholderiaceae bacterium]|jgi:peptidylprolyl isomerase|nr:peptidylprolyl isomerase [Burkholderiaceae bacterium]